MNKVIVLFSLCCFLLLSVAAGHAEDPGWPRQMNKNGNTLIIYQPQVDDWKNFAELDWRMAVSLTPKGGKPAIGIVTLKGDTQVDNAKGMVLITNLKIRESRFPSLEPENAARMEELMRSFLPPTVAISLQRLVACVPKKETPRGVQLKNDPPQIFVSYQPAILLAVDGQPVRVPIEKTSLEYVLNTHWQLFYDKLSGLYYLMAGEQWLQAAELSGNWALAGKLPADMKKLAKDSRWANLQLSGKPAKKTAAAVPQVFYSTTPAEIIYINGTPDYVQIPGTGLQYVANTTSYLFSHLPTGRFYYLTSGRWFSAASLSGPWTFATAELPEDFSRIPTSSPASQVLASVPGTDEAKDAVLLAQIPTAVTVNPAAAAKEAKVTYAGEPRFVPIDGTTLYYATNTAQKVIRVGDLYYLCLQGIWFVSPNPQGPWQTAQSVPAVIYTIPPSSPVYNITYVTQTTAPDGSVVASYTSGYTGVYVMSTSSTVVVTSGTGYYYPPYIAPYPVYGYPVYYPPPPTYGYASHYQTAAGAYGVSQTAYGAYGTATRTASYNPYTGTATRTASVSTAYGSAAAGQAYNPYTGASAATRQGSNAYGSWGSSVVTKGGETAYTQHQTTAKGTTGSVQTSSGGKAVGASSQYGSTAVGKSSSGDVYAGHDGNAYKKTDSGWQKYDNGSWTPVDSSAKQPAQTSAASHASGQQTAAASTRQSAGQPAQQAGSLSGQGKENEQMQRLQQEAQNRQRGAESSQRSQEMRQGFGGGGSEGRGFGGGGGRSFGGGGGRRR